jgi:hypothetical protein
MVHAWGHEMPTMLLLLGPYGIPHHPHTGVGTTRAITRSGIINTTIIIKFAFLKVGDIPFAMVGYRLHGRKWNGPRTVSIDTTTGAAEYDEDEDDTTHRGEDGDNDGGCCTESTCAGGVVDGEGGCTGGVGGGCRATSGGASL